MKRNDSGDFCVLFIEAADERGPLFETIAEQKKPVVLMVAAQARVFQRPDDFNALKHLRRQIERPVMFVASNNEQQAQLAMRYGFPVFASMDALSEALALGQATRQRVLARPTGPLNGSHHNSRPLNSPEPNSRPGAPIRRTIPLLDEDLAQRRTGPLVASHPPLTRSGPQVSTPVSPPPRRPEPLTPLPLPSAPMRPEPLTGRPRQGRRVWPIALVVLLTVALTFAVVGSFLVFLNKPLNVSNSAATAAIVGHVSFVSSEQVSENSSQGIMDQVVVDFSNLSPPPSGKSDYAWLLGDKKQSDLRALFLGKLTPAAGGRAHLFYPGDAAHTNLLLTNSRFLVTEEDATIPPIAPSPDQHSWRYYGEFMQTPISTGPNAQPFSYLDHLRHLLASDPTLDEMELAGGLNNWLYINTGKVLEWTNSIRQQWEDGKDVGFVRRQTTRTLTYLDGLSYVKQDLAPGTPLLVNERLARVGLLCVNGPTQDPACYTTHIVHHLSGLLEVIKPTPEMRKSLADLVSALNNATYWFTQMRQDAQKLMKMSDQQIQQAATLSVINDMINNANHAYSGDKDPATGETRQGVIWAHTHMQDLATIDIRAFSSAAGTSIQMVPNTQPKSAANPAGGRP